SRRRHTRFSRDWSSHVCSSDLENYEIIDPQDVGIAESSILLTARSGRAALKHRLEVLGLEYQQDQFEGIYDTFLKLADSKKDIRSEERRVGRERRSMWRAAQGA